MYRCGKKNINDKRRETVTGTIDLCSRFKLEDKPRKDKLSLYLADLTKKAIEPLKHDNLTHNLGNLNDILTFCECRDNMCNIKEESTIKCYSTPVFDRQNLVRYDVENLHEQNFFDNEKNLIACPPLTKQCYSRGKRLCMQILV